ncbi:uncharacterized protein LOC132514612 isoform X2 [Lagenorhynchus albirostris]|uniref:uncharacterized protein LOC132514612 isoform X2 n=1 Tax=Lagenorhynchus albirostris TaxID=27610 RepID=UPI0028E7E750|nr:uncharacterized protein LOC132514612 isoform X2 [Lagenorhynchus albirostris]
MQKEREDKTFKLDSTAEEDKEGRHYGGPTSSGQSKKTSEGKKNKGIGEAESSSSRRSKGKLELQEGKSGVSNNISLPEEMKTEGKAIEYSSWMHGGIVSLDRTSIHCMGFEVRILVPETYQFLLCNSAKEVVIIRKMSQWKREYTTHGTALEEQPRPQDFSGKMTAYNVEDGPKGRADLEAKDYYSNP